MFDGCCIEGVSVRETGEFEWFESPEVVFGGARPLILFGWLGVGRAAERAVGRASSDWWMG